MNETISGHYLLSRKYSATGANRVEFEIRGTQINVNNSGFREATVGELSMLKHAAELLQKEGRP
jgi:hypothetical protein